MDENINPENTPDGENVLGEKPKLIQDISIINCQMNVSPATFNPEMVCECSVRFNVQFDNMGNIKYMDGDDEIAGLYNRVVLYHKVKHL